jgi:Fe-S cluster biogenesis protein NfuA
MGGGCQGCAASSITLKKGVESMIKAEIDEINEIVDITNHDAGINPYYKKGASAIQQTANPSPLVKGR